MLENLFKSFNSIQVIQFNLIEEDGLQVFQGSSKVSSFHTLWTAILISSIAWNTQSLTFYFNIPNGQKLHELRSSE
jgi:hypothetical protein